MLMPYTGLEQVVPLFWSLFGVLAIWEMIWKGVAMWKAGRNNQLAWYVCILIFNTVGLLPIIYLLLFQRKRK